MTLSNAEILARIDAAMKNIVTPGDFGTSILQPEKFDQFVRAMQHRTVIMSEARFIKMDAQQVDIDRVGFVGRILRSGTNAAGQHRELNNPALDYAMPQFNTNSLIARELQAVAGIRDTALRRNIERGGFESTLIDLFGEAAGRDFEEWAILANQNILWALDDVLSLTNGWIQSAANAVYGVAGPGGARHFDPTDVDSMFNAMLTALPKQFLQDTREWRYWVDWATMDSYRDILRARATELGDRAQTGADELVFKGIPVRYCPMMERSRAFNAANNTWGRVALLGHPDNMAWGIFHEVTIERDRIPRDRRTDFVLTLEGDVGYEDENAAVAAFLEVPRP